MSILGKKFRLLGLTLVMSLAVLGSTAAAEEAATAAATPAAAVPAEIQDVHSIYWKAILKSAQTGRNSAGETATINAGSKVIVTERPSGSSSCTCTKNGYVFTAPKKALNFVADACTIKQGDYNVATKEYFVNDKHHFSSPTDYLIWASLDKQRINVFRKDEATGRWKLFRVGKICSGGPTTPTKVSFFLDVGFKKRVYHYSSPTFSATVEYFLEFAGSGFHKFIGGGRKNLGRHPISHGCVRVSTKLVIWMFKNIPVHTRVINY